MDAMMKVGNLVKTKENTLQVPKGTLGIVIAVHGTWTGPICEVRFFGPARFRLPGDQQYVGRYTCGPDNCILEVVL